MGATLQWAANWDVLEEDGKAGPKTRAQLIGDYMRHDRTSLPAGVSVTTHGCGEYFPLDPTLEEVEQVVRDGERDLTDRRVELFFFDGALGVQPPARGRSRSEGPASTPSGG